MKKTIEEKISALEGKRQELEEELSQLKQKRHEEIGALIQHIDFQDTDTETLMGALLASLDPDISKDQKEEWQKAGKKFCRHLRSQKRSQNTPVSRPQAAT